MKRHSIIMIIILIVSLSIMGCENREDTVNKMDAEDFTISYGKSIYQAKDKVEQHELNSLIETYNNITLDGTTNQEITYDKAVTIVFINKDQISGQITIDDKGIYRIDDNTDNYFIEDENKIYEEFLKVYHHLQEKYDG